MNVKMIVEEWLKEHGYDGLCNTEAPCGCLPGNLAPCGEMCWMCRPGHRTEVAADEPCGCDGEGEAHWHVAPEAEQRTGFDGFWKKAQEWLCECGERCVPTAGEWRWNGQDWEHYHGYPMGHVAAKRVPSAEGGGAA